jgi:hypothetical protein
VRPAALSPFRRTPRKSKNISIGMARMVSALAVFGTGSLVTPRHNSNAPVRCPAARVGKIRDVLQPDTCQRGVNLGSPDHIDLSICQIATPRASASQRRDRNASPEMFRSCASRDDRERIVLHRLWVLLQEFKNGTPGCDRSVGIIAGRARWLSIAIG